MSSSDYNKIRRMAIMSLLLHNTIEIWTCDNLMKHLNLCEDEMKNRNFYCIENRKQYGWKQKFQQVQRFYHAGLRHNLCETGPRIKIMLLCNNNNIQ